MFIFIFIMADIDWMDVASGGENTSLQAKHINS